MSGYADDEIADQVLAGLCRLDAVVTVADAVHIARRLADSPDAADQVALAREWVDVALMLGAPCLRVFAGPVPEGHTEEEAMAWCMMMLAPKEMPFSRPIGARACRAVVTAILTS